jgi:hypothetical protein
LLQAQNPYVVAEEADQIDSLMREVHMMLHKMLHVTKHANCL